MAQVDPRLVFSDKRVLSAAVVCAVVGWGGVLVGFATDRKGTYFAYLTAFAFVASIALGGLILLMTTYLVGARWSIVIRRFNEAVVSVFPVLALLFVPLVFGLSELYVWVNPPARFADHELVLMRHKQAYLNEPFFVARSVGYFVLWIVAALMLRRWSLSRDTAVAADEPEHRVHERERALSAALLPFVALALTFASFDWLMSLQPLWTSTLFGVYYFAGGFLATFGALSVLAFAAERAGSLRGMIRPPHFHALGRLMFAFTIFWAYNAFFQAMLIRIANRPEEIEFYQHRTQHGWDIVLWVVVLGRFALPFALLLSRSIKFRGGAMAAIGAWILVAHYLDIFWLVAPAHPEHGPLVNVWDVSALLAILGTTVAYGAALMRGKPLIPVGDPVLARSIEYRSST
jgi:hypothetical protein